MSKTSEYFTREESENIGEEFEKILSLAEELETKCERYSTWINIIRMAEIVLGCFIVFFAVYLAVSDYTHSGMFPVTLAMLPVGVLYIVITEYIMVRRYTQRRRRDARALYEVVEILREMGEELGASKSWSVLDKAQYRIRLSRFSIGGNKF